MQGWPNIVDWINILLVKLYICWGITYSIMENRCSSCDNTSSYGTGGVSLLLVTQSTSSPLPLLSLPFSPSFFHCHRTHYLWVTILISFNLLSCLLNAKCQISYHFECQCPTVHAFTRALHACQLSLLFIIWLI